jgi:hypothetical protein
MSTINWVSGTIGLVSAGLILYLVRRDHLHTRYAIWWIPIALIIAILGLAPQLVDLIGNALGIHYPPVIPLIIGLAVMIVKILLMDIERSENEVKLARLVQRVAILQRGLEDALEKNKDQKVE